MLGKSFTNIAKDLSNGFGIGKSVFGGTSVSRSDIEAVKNMSSAMKNGSTLAQAWRENLNGCSSAIKTQIYECKKSGKSLDELIVRLEGTGTASKAAAIGMNLLSTTANMAVSFGISMLIQGLFQVISASNDIREQAQEVGSAFNNTESDINSYKERVQELHDTINDSQSSFQDITDARKELLLFRLQVTAYSFDTYILQLTFFNFHLSWIVELAIYRCLFSDSIQVHCHFNWICNDCYLSFYTIHLYH